MPVIYAQPEFILTLYIEYESGFVKPSPRNPLSQKLTRDGTFRGFPEYILGIPGLSQSAGFRYVRDSQTSDPSQLGQDLINTLIPHKQNVE